MARNRTQGRTQSGKRGYGLISLLVAIIVLQLSYQVHRTGSVLSYATAISTAGLHTAQNNQRAANGLAPLSVNTQLAVAAQNKANDMAARNYWSHNTPEGSPPWVFITNAGYSYQKAGENLAYGFNSSTEAVQGWMDSATHKANVLDSAYLNVGFGVANSADYQAHGEQTIVVAMYGQPSAPAVAPAAPVAPQSKAPQTKVEPTAPQEETIVVTVEEAPEQQVEVTSKAINTEAPVRDNAVPEVRGSVVSKILKGNAHWSVYLTSFMTAYAALWFGVKHFSAIRRSVVDGEAFVLTHPAVEISLLAAAVLLLYASTSGVVR